MESNIEEITSSLVREYLSRKGLKNTLSTLDQELPRTELSISKRSALAKAAKIEVLMKKNKAGQTTPYQTMLEVLVNYIISNPVIPNGTMIPKKLSPSSSPSASPKMGRLSDGKPITYTKHHAKPQLQANSIRKTPVVKTSEKPNSGFKPLQSFPNQTCAPSPLPLPVSDRDTGLRKPTLEQEEQHYKTQASHGLSHDIKTGVAEETLTFQDLEEEEVVVIDNEFVYKDPPLTTRVPSISGSAINTKTAQALRSLVFGSADGPSFNNEWRMQGFTFQALPNLKYGLIQHKGGPCGLLACVQAYLLKHILFSDKKSCDQIPQLSSIQQTEVLVTALSCILWKVHDQSVTVALKSFGNTSGRVHPVRSRRYVPDGVTEQLTLHEFTSYSALKTFLGGHIKSFTSEGVNNDGCILFLYSVILSHGIDRVVSEMDDSGNFLIGAHGYCSQELVNLLITGTASSNVFDGQATLEAVNDGPILRGVSSSCDIGYLTLFEHYGTCRVGNFLKNPHFPIWVVCSESHYSVLFGLTMDILEKERSLNRFSLHYYDGLAHLPEPIILSIEVGNKGFFNKGTSKGLTPPLESVIKTRWTSCTSIKWNLEPLL